MASKLSHIIASLIILLSVTSGFSQDYAPFRTGWTYTFSYDSDYLWDMAIDSVVPMGADTQYFFNPILRKENHVVDTCADPGYDYYANQENIFGRSMIKMAVGDYAFQMDDGSSLLIRTQVPVGTSWSLGTGGTGTLISKSPGIVLGVTDTIMQISLSTGDTLLISKSYGFVGTYTFVPIYSYLGATDPPLTSPTSYSMELAGITELGLGLSIPKFKQVFDYDVGDELSCYSTMEFPPCNEEEYWTKYTILSKTVDSSFTFYSYTAIREYVQIIEDCPYSSSSPDTSYTLDTVTFNRNLTDYTFLNTLSRETGVAMPGYSSLHNYSRLNPLLNNRVTRNMELYGYNVFGNTCYDYYNELLDALQSHEYTDGLGLTFREHFGPFVTLRKELECYTKTTDAIGPCVQLNLLITSQENSLLQESMNLFPNPNEGKFRLEATGLPAGEYTVKMIDLFGRSISSRNELVSTERIDLEFNLQGVAVGTYWVRVESKDGYSLVRRVQIR